MLLFASRACPHVHLLAHRGNRHRGWHTAELRSCQGMPFASSMPSDARVQMNLHSNPLSEPLMEDMRVSDFAPFGALGLSLDAMELDPDVAPLTPPLESMPPPSAMAPPQHRTTVSAAEDGQEAPAKRAKGLDSEERRVLKNRRTAKTSRERKQAHKAFLEAESARLAAEQEEMLRTAHELTVEGRVLAEQVTAMRQMIAKLPVLKSVFERMSTHDKLAAPGPELYLVSAPIVPKVVSLGQIA